MWAGIIALVDALESMANGTLVALPYLSPLDPGVGKTETVVEFRELLGKYVAEIKEGNDEVFSKHPYNTTLH